MNGMRRTWTLLVQETAEAPLVYKGDVSTYESDVSPTPCAPEHAVLQWCLLWLMEDPIPLTNAGLPLSVNCSLQGLESKPTTRASNVEPDTVMPLGMPLRYE